MTLAINLELLPIFICPSMIHPGPIYTFSPISTPSPIKSTLQEKPKLPLNEKQIESESLSDIVDSLQKQLEQKQVTLKEIQSKNLLI